MVRDRCRVKRMTLALSRLCDEWQFGHMSGRNKKEVLGKTQTGQGKSLQLCWKWHPIPYIVYYFWPELYRIWSIGCYFWCSLHLFKVNVISEARSVVYFFDSSFWPALSESWSPSHFHTTCPPGSRVCPSIYLYLRKRAQALPLQGHRQVREGSEGMNQRRSGKTHTYSGRVRLKSARTNCKPTLVHKRHTHSLAYTIPHMHTPSLKSSHLGYCCFSNRQAVWNQERIIQS